MLGLCPLFAKPPTLDSVDTYQKKIVLNYYKQQKIRINKFHSKERPKNNSVSILDDISLLKKYLRDTSILYSEVLASCFICEDPNELDCDSQHQFGNWALSPTGAKNVEMLDQAVQILEVYCNDAWSLTRDYIFCSAANLSDHCCNITKLNNLLKNSESFDTIFSNPESMLLQYLSGSAAQKLHESFLLEGESRLRLRLYEEFINCLAVINPNGDGTEFFIRLEPYYNIYRNHSISKDSKTIYKTLYTSEIQIQALQVLLGNNSVGDQEKKDTFTKELKTFKDELMKYDELNIQSSENSIMLGYNKVPIILLHNLIMGYCKVVNLIPSEWNFCVDYLKFKDKEGLSSFSTALRYIVEDGKGVKLTSSERQFLKDFTDDKVNPWIKKIEFSKKERVGSYIILPKEDLDQKDEGGIHPHTKKNIPSNNDNN